MNDVDERFLAVDFSYEWFEERATDCLELRVDLAKCTYVWVDRIGSFLAQPIDELEAVGERHQAVDLQLVVDALETRFYVIVFFVDLFGDLFACLMTRLDRNLS